MRAHPSAQVVLVQGSPVDPEPMRLRLAVMAAFGVTATRRGQHCALPHLLFSSPPLFP